MAHPSSQRLRYARERRFQTAAAAARAIGAKPGTWSAWENDVTGNGVPYPAAVRAATVLGVSPEWIMRGVGLGPEGPTVPDPLGEPSIPQSYLALAARVVSNILLSERIPIADSDRAELLVDVANVLMLDNVPAGASVEVARKAFSRGMIATLLKGRGLRTTG